MDGACGLARALLHAIRNDGWMMPVSKAGGEGYVPDGKSESGIFKVV